MGKPNMPIKKSKNIYDSTWINDRKTGQDIYPSLNFFFFKSLRHRRWRPEKHPWRTSLRGSPPLATLPWPSPFARYICIPVLVRSPAQLCTNECNNYLINPTSRSTQTPRRSEIEMQPRPQVWGHGEGERSEPEPNTAQVHPRRNETCPRGGSPETVHYLHHSGERLYQRFPRSPKLPPCTTQMVNAEATSRQSG